MVYGGPGPATHGDITFGDRFGDRLEQGRVHHPQEAPGVLVHQPAAPGDFVAGRSEQVLGRSTGTRGEEDAVPWLGAGGGGQAVAFSVADVLAHRSTQGAVLGDRDIGQALGTALLCPVLPGVEGAPRLGRAAGHHDGPHVGRLEDSERGVGEVVGQLGELQIEAKVGLVGAEPVHGLGVGEPRQRTRQLEADQRPDLGDDLLGQPDHIVLVDEAHLDVELGELGLPVGAEVLVSVAASDLVVPFHPRHHQQLLEQLRALRQCVPRAGRQPGRYHEVTRTLRGAAGERRGLDLHEIVRGEHFAGGGVDLAAQPQQPTRFWTTQVEVAMPESGVLAHVDSVIDRERQRSRRAEHLERADRDLDLPSRHVGIHSVGRTGLDYAADRHAELVAQLVSSQFVDQFLTNHALHDARRVPQVDEDHAAVIAAGVHPTGEPDSGTNLGRAQRTCLVGANHDHLPFG